MTSLFKRNLSEQIALLESAADLDEHVDAAGRLISAALMAGNKVMFCGNGGSAADSQHLAAELTGRFIKDRVPLAALALSTDSSALTCIANDYSFADIFARQVLALAREGDCLVGISTSGRSENVIRAFDAARSLGTRTIGFLGRDGGALKALSDVAIVVPSTVTARIQECHILIGHTICGMVEQQLGLVEQDH